MTRINLLPWREELREEQKREYTYMLGGSAIASVLIMGVIHFGMMQKIAYQNSRNTLLRNEIV
jgi:type IV pilus assembly protein PilN